MEKFIPFEKLSKKKKKELNKAKRNTWGMTNPVTRREKNPKAYDRNKLRSEKSETEFIFFCIKHIVSADILIDKSERNDYIYETVIQKHGMRSCHILYPLYDRVLQCV